MYFLRGQYDLIEQRKTLYQYVGCDPEVLLETAASKCPNFQPEKKSVEEQPKTETTKPKVELVTAETVEGEKKETTTEKPATTTAEEPTESTTTSQEPESTTEEKKAERPTGNDVGGESETIPSDMIISKLTVTQHLLNLYVSEKDGCFEVIDNHLMVSVAGGLEHDVSIEECQCMCANSM